MTSSNLSSLQKDGFTDMSLDPDVMSRSQYGMVIFSEVLYNSDSNLVCQFYPKFLHDFDDDESLYYSIKYMLGLFKVPHNLLDDVILSKEVSIVEHKPGQDLEIIFENSELPSDPVNFYQFQFWSVKMDTFDYTEKKSILGASIPFKLVCTSPKVDEHSILCESDDFIVVGHKEAETSISETSQEYIDDKFVYMTRAILQPHKDYLRSLQMKIIQPLNEEAERNLLKEAKNFVMGCRSYSYPADMDILMESINEQKKKNLVNLQKIQSLESELENKSLCLNEQKNKFEELSAVVVDLQEKNKSLVHQTMEKDREIEDMRIKLKSVDTAVVSTQTASIVKEPLFDYQILHEEDKYKIHLLEQQIKQLHNDIKMQTSSNYLEIEHLKQDVGKLMSSMSAGISVSSTETVPDEHLLQSSVIQQAVDSTINQEKEKEEEHTEELPINLPESKKKLESTPSYVPLLVRNILNVVPKVIKPMFSSGRVEQTDSQVREPENTTNEEQITEGASNSYFYLTDDGQVLQHKSILECPFCKMQFSINDTRKLEHHMEDHLSNTKECPLCYETFTDSQSDFENHVQKHFDDPCGFEETRTGMWDFDID